MLQPLSVVYRLAAQWQRDRSLVQSLPVPVIVVGNVVVGGAGKTPATIALVQALRQRGFVPGVVSRGYGRRSKSLLAVGEASSALDVGDEPLLIYRRTQAPVFVGRNRASAGQALLAAHPDVNIIVADDGLQHHALARDAQLILIDERGFGNGLLLPAGPLREHAGASPPARSEVLYNAAALSTAWPGSFAQRTLQGAVRLADWHAGVQATHHALKDLAGMPLAAAAGVAAPSRFFAMLEAQGLKPLRIALPDHFGWQQWPAIPADTVLIVTEKDAIKLSAHHAHAKRIWVAPLDFKIPEALIDALLAWVDKRPSNTLREP